MKTQSTYLVPMSSMLNSDIKFKFTLPYTEPSKDKFAISKNLAEIQPVVLCYPKMTITVEDLASNIRTLPIGIRIQFIVKKVTTKTRNIIENIIKSNN